MKPWPSRNSVSFLGREGRNEQRSTMCSLSCALLPLIWVLPLLLLALTGCESTDGGGGGGSASLNTYYGAGTYDPWYYGDDIDVIVTPPERPEAPPKPTHPIAPPSMGPRPMPMPSIPSTPRGGGRR